MKNELKKKPKAKIKQNSCFQTQTKEEAEAEEDHKEAVITEEGLTEEDSIEEAIIEANTVKDVIVLEEAEDEAGSTANKIKKTVIKINRRKIYLKSYAGDVTSQVTMHPFVLRKSQKIIY